MAGAQEIILERDGHDQPWGFRLQGGSDVGMPLSIQRVLVGTPSDGVLKKGDVLLRISRTDARGLTHQQAADLFTNVGNQISFIIKRTGGGQTQTHTASTTNSTIAPPNPVPISGGVALPGMATHSQGKSFNTLPTSKAAQQHGTSAPLSLTIQNQPYRTSPLIQPTAYEKLDLGPGSSQHLKMQVDHITGARDPLSSFSTPRASEFSMKQKVTGTLQQIQQSTTPPPLSQSPSLMQSQVPVKQYYNNPINLYSTENIAEVAKLNKMGISGLPGATCTSPTGLLNPHRPQQVAFGPVKEYNPKESATWLALQETDPSIDPEKLKNYSTLREHKPIYAEVYEAPKHPLDKKVPAVRPVPAKVFHNNPSEGACQQEQTEFHSSVKSPVAEFLPSKLYKKAPESPIQTNPGRSNTESQPSAVLSAALAEEHRTSANYNSDMDLDNIPLYETNSIGGRKRIAQSATFNKLMMDVLGQ